MREGVRKLTVCVVNFNGSRYVDGALRAILDQGDRIGEVLFVDNASEDDSVVRVEQDFPDIEILRLPENRGPGAARNAGYRAARYPRILFVDNDIILSTGCADRLDAAMDAEPDAVAAMPRVLHADEPDLIQFDGADSHYLGIMLLRSSGSRTEGSRSGTSRLGSIVTACILIDRGVWGTDAPFDESFFFNYEDHDFGVRARCRGHVLLGVTSASCLHREGTPGLSLRPGGAYGSQRVLCLIRNRWLILLKNYELRSLLLFSPMLFLYEVGQLAEVIHRGWFPEWTRAVRWITSHAREVWSKRLETQAARRVRDREVLCAGPLGFRPELMRSGVERFAGELLDRASRAYWSLVVRML